jgi:hypothetical protein
MHQDTYVHTFNFNCKKVVTVINSIIVMTLLQEIS